MPMNRYEIRNEYSLADPELYRAADKDDPEALLEGVAMAGLVGALRQLGDLAEFAAEIFHDLHQEVMATAAKGHSLMIRVQQLEAEVPSIEKAFLSQTNHSSFFYDSGVDWHPNLRMNQNLVTQGDLPRFIMDSHEECRGPPRLFLLDKFDVAGAGACLKRYTDPSFFKVETSAMVNVDIPREKKIRKAKKKGQRGRHGEKPEILPASHAKVHQLFLEEPVENGVGKPAHRPRLKRRLNGFAFDSKTRKSYMETLLKTPPPEHNMLHEIAASPALQLSTNDHNESDLDVLESVGPGKESEGIKRHPPSSDREEIILDPFRSQTNDVSTDIEICEVHSYLKIATDGSPSTFDAGDKDITVGGESKTVGSLTGYQSDGIASEIDNYVDAPSTIESEMDTDFELRMKNDFTSSYIKIQQLIAVKNEEHLRFQSLDSQSTGDLTISDDGNNSRKKEISSSLSSDSPRTSTENPQSEKLSCIGFPSADIPEIAIVNASFYQKNADEDFPVDELPYPVVPHDTFSGKNAVPKSSPDCEQQTSNLCITNSVPNLLHHDSGGVARKDRLTEPKSDETATTSDDGEKKTDLIIDSPCSPSVSQSKSQSGDDSPRSSSGEHLMDGENAPRLSTVANTLCHTSDNSAAISACLLHEDDYDCEDLNHFEIMTSTLDMHNVLSENRADTEEIISNENPGQGEFDTKPSKSPYDFVTDYTGASHNGDDNTSKVPEGEKQNEHSYNEDSNVVSDAPIYFSCFLEDSIVKELRKTSLTNAEAVDSEDHYCNYCIENQNSSETLILLVTENSPNLLEAGLDGHEGNFVPKGTTTVNETPEVGPPKSGEVLELQGRGITDDGIPNDLVALTSFSTPENLEDPEGISDTAEKDKVNPDNGISGLELNETSISANLKLLSKVHLLSDESDTKTDQSETVMDCSGSAVSDNTIKENVSLPADLHKLVEEQVPCFEDSGPGELQNEVSLSGSYRESELVKEENSCLSGNHIESSLVEGADEREAATLDSYTIFCSIENNDRLKSEVSHTAVNTYIDSEVEQSMIFVDAAQIQSPPGQSGLETESLQLCCVENQASDANLLPFDWGTEGKMLQEKIELPPNGIDQELPDSGEMNLELSPLLPVNHQQMLDNDDNEGKNNFASSFPFVGFPPSVSEHPSLRNYGNDVSAYSKDSLVLMLPPSSLFSETNQINLDELPPLPPLPPLQWRMARLQLTSSTRGVEKIEHTEEFPQEVSQCAFTSNSSFSLEQVNHSPTQIVPQIILKEENVENSSPTLDASSMHETINLPPKIENEQQQLVMFAQDSEVTSPAEEDGNANGSRAVKLPRSCNPVIGSVEALDKSKLRKVTERIKPQLQTPDERDSLMEQIRTKSFNLKPAVASRPSIQGPKTNLKVAAILEKANAIRQALAGSDEDDEGNWSDS